MRGEVAVRVACLLPERLLERALKRGARFDRVCADGDRDLVVECDAASARILTEVCARYRLDAKVVARRGRSALAAYARRRATLPVGLLVAAALCWLFLGRIWLIDIAFVGDAAALGDRGALAQALSDAGVAPGMRRDVDLGALEKRLQAEAGSCASIGARLRGVRLLIEAEPEIPSPPLYDVAAARDLVADRDGIVISAVARAGELCVQPGDAVRRGQLLIRGEEKAGAEEVQPIAALGEVVVRAWFTGEATLPTRETRTLYTGRTATASRLRTPWRSWPITEGEAFADEIRHTETLPVGGLFLPVAVERETRREVARRQAALDERALRAQLEALAMADAARRLSDEGPATYQVLRRWVDIAPAGGDALRARAVIEISVNAAVTREALADAEGD